jgi:hypothetical protein
VEYGHEVVETLVENGTGKGLDAAAIWSAGLSAFSASGLSSADGLTRLTPSHFDGLPANRRTLGIAAREPQSIPDAFRHHIRARIHGGVIAPLPVSLVLLNDPRHRSRAFSSRSPKETISQVF